MGIQDQRIDWIRKRLWLTPFDTQSFVGDGTSGLVGAETAGITTVEVAGVGMMTSVMVAGEFLNGYFRCPYDLDPEWPVGFRVCWTLDHDGSGNAVITWILLQNAIAEGIAIALPATALDTPLDVNDPYQTDAGIASTTDFLLMWTERGIRNKVGLTRTQIENGAFLTFKLEMDAALNETSAHYIGMEMDYAPMKTLGVGSHTDPSLTGFDTAG